MNIVEMMKNYVPNDSIAPLDLLLFDRIYIDGQKGELSRYYHDLDSNNVSAYLEGEITFEDLINPSPYLGIKLHEKSINMIFTKNRLERWKEAEIPSLTPTQKQLIQVMIESDTSLLPNWETGNSVHKYIVTLLLLCTKWEASISYSNIDLDCVPSICFTINSIFTEYNDGLNIHCVFPTSDMKKVASILEENETEINSYEKVRKERDERFLTAFLQTN